MEKIELLVGVLDGNVIVLVVKNDDILIKVYMVVSEKFASSVIESDAEVTGVVIVVNDTMIGVVVVEIETLTVLVVG